MKTNFLYFKEHGKHVTVVSGAYSGNQDFLLLDDSGSNVEFAANVTDKTHVKVEVTFAEAQTTKVGSAYSGGDAAAGETITINNTGKSLTSGSIRIAKQTADGTNGVTLSTGDIVTITRIPTEGTEACFRADRLLSVHSNSDTQTEITFKASNSSVGDDIVILTHTTGYKNFKLIAEYINDVCNGKLGGDFINVCDIQDDVLGQGLRDAGVTNMELTIA